MVETEITFQNKTETRVQAQIYAGRTLISTCVIDPGEIHVLPATPMHYDVFFKDGATGWEFARKLGTNASNITLIQHKNRYTISVAKDDHPLDSVPKSELAGNVSGK